MTLKGIPLWEHKAEHWLHIFHSEWQTIWYFFIILLVITLNSSCQLVRLQDALQTIVRFSSANPLTLLEITTLGWSEEQNRVAYYKSDLATLDAGTNTVRVQGQSSQCLGDESSWLISDQIHGLLLADANVFSVCENLQTISKTH